MEHEIWNFIGKIVAYGGGIVGISYAVFVFFGKKIIDEKFSKRQLDFKHQKDKDLADYKTKIDSLLNRITKIHEKEFQVLPEAWNLLQDCFMQLSYFTRIVREYPDFSKMRSEQLQAFLDNSILYDFEKKQLIEETDKLSYFQNVIFWHEYNDVRNAFSNFVQFIKRNRIFLSKDLKEKFEFLEKIMWSAIVDQEVGHQAEDHKMKREAYQTVNDKIGPIVEEIESMVQKRLKYTEAE